MHVLNFIADYGAALASIVGTFIWIFNLTRRLENRYQKAELKQSQRITNFEDKISEFFLSISSIFEANIK